MKVRRLDSGGDMRLGHGSADFFEDSADGVAQNAMTRLALWRGQWFLDTSEGTPWIQEILGKQEAANAAIRARILETPGVLGITEYESILDPDARSLTVTATLETQYGEAVLTETL